MGGAWPCGAAEGQQVPCPPGPRGQRLSLPWPRCAHTLLSAYLLASFRNMSTPFSYFSCKCITATASWGFTVEETFLS
ncbi:hypothetical protein llap_1559 [Limosa lapponica baueri]|uniref:Uncharacterized protein n=1 Tax=Limosa lapponica baueri TaxID=1758121 RepID=A0A2I0UPW5_LIMLA|nr:hypothetical protein llap_1559 [Limosa lapponica baueri]